MRDIIWPPAPFKICYLALTWNKLHEPEFTSYPGYICSITIVFRVKSDNSELSFQSTYPNSALYTDIP